MDETTDMGTSYPACAVRCNVKPEAGAKPGLPVSCGLPRIVGRAA
jgi:hypothetical protein